MNLSNRPLADPVARALRAEGQRLQRACDPAGSVLSRVMAQLPEDGSPADTPESATPVRRPLRWRPAGALLAAAGLLLVALPGVGLDPSVPSPVVTPATPLPWLAASELERMHPVRLLQALPEPLTALVEAEGDALQADVRRAARRFRAGLPALLRPGSAGRE